MFNFLFFFFFVSGVWMCFLGSAGVGSCYGVSEYYLGRHHAIHTWILLGMKAYYIRYPSGNKVNF